MVENGNFSTVKKKFQKVWSYFACNFSIIIAQKKK
jgi:hypothetical protein